MVLISQLSLGRSTHRRRKRSSQVVAAVWPPQLHAYKNLCIQDGSFCGGHTAPFKLFSGTDGYEALVGAYVLAPAALSSGRSSALSSGHSPDYSSGHSRGSSSQPHPQHCDHTALRSYERHHGGVKALFRFHVVVGDVEDCADYKR